ncbi:TPA: Rz1 family lipoprotein [Vibrio vulnificus]
MQKLKYNSLVIACALVLSACTSRQAVHQQCPVPIAPEAWAMQDPQDLATQLEKIIYVSE